MNRYIILVILVFICASFFIGRCTRSDNKYIIDSLTNKAFDYKHAEQEHENTAKKLYKEIQDEKSARFNIESLYKQTLVVLHSLTKAKKDRRARILLNVSEWDTTNFSDSAVTSVLDLGAKEQKFESLTKSDSALIEKMEWSYADLDSALTDSKNENNTKDKIIIEDKKAAKKPHWWELPALAVSLILGFWLGSL